MSSPPKPGVDVDSAPFWEGTRRHALLVQRCNSCDRLRFPPRPVCPQCRGWDHEWIETSGEARVLSWVVNHQRFHPAFQDVPYVTVLVGLAEQGDVAMYGGFDGSLDSLAVGLRVRTRFVDVEDGFTLVNWEAAR